MDVAPAAANTTVYDEIGHLSQKYIQWRRQTDGAATKFKTEFETEGTFTHFTIYLGILVYLSTKFKYQPNNN